MIKERYTHDGRIIQERTVDLPMWESEGPIVVTDELLAGYAAGRYMPVDVQRLVAAELLAVRNARAIEAASAT